jgi:hypothetical protein
MAAVRLTIHTSDSEGVTVGSRGKWSGGRVYTI